jgi:cytoskeleton protein RodZ
MLRAARVAQELTIEQVATELRIEAKQLNALEEDRLEQIGVPVFVKGYIKQYGQRLGVDVRDLLALYYKQTKLADVLVQPNRTLTLRDERQITSWVLAAVVLLVVIVALAVWWWSGGTFTLAPLQSTAPPAAPSAAPTDAPAAAPAARSAAELPRAAPADEAPRPAETPAAPPSEGGEANAPVAAGADRLAAGDDTSDERAAPVVAIPLELSFDQESWAEITDARGERLVFGLNAAGRQVRVRGQPPFAIVLGNANAVRLTVDGEPYEIPRTGRQGDLARFAVDIAEE